MAAFLVLAMSVEAQEIFSAAKEKAIAALIAARKGTEAFDSMQSQITGPVTVGAERTEAYLPLLEGKKVAVVANQASRIGERHLVDSMLTRGVDIQCIFCPEHGFRGDAEAGAHVADNIDPMTGIPIVSLYGNNKKPKAEQLRGIEVVVFDLQDVGCRFYTYISTLHYVMEACAENGVKMVLLDRPNPNGHYVDGPVLEKKYQSFVGMHPVPIVYGMTIGEYAQMINGEGWLAGGLRCDITVITLQNYTHNTPYSLPVAPSPNLQTDQAIALYPSLCLFEGTNISVGRGTGRPFEMIGAPNYRKTSGCTIPSLEFTPKSIKGVSENPPFKGQTCNGLILSDEPKPMRFELGYLMEMYKGTRGSDFFLKSGFFEKLAGTADLRKQLQDGASEEEIRKSWEPKLSEFKECRKKYLLYTDFE